MIFWLKKRWFKIADAIEDYLSWSNLVKLCIAILALWFLHNLLH